MCIKESTEYIEDRKKFLMKSGLKVNLRTGRSPDEDILYVTNAKHFISTGGNYGRLLNIIKK
jgi:peptidase E